MGLLDWLTDGSLFGGSSPGGMPPVQMTGTDAAPLNSYMKGYDNPSAPGPTPTPPMPPMPTDTPAASPLDTLTPPPAPGLTPPVQMIGSDAAPLSSPEGGLSGAVPIPRPRPAAVSAAPPVASTIAPPAASPSAAPPAGIPAGPIGASTEVTPSPATATPAAADNGGGFMGRFKSAIGGGFGAGLTAAGNSAGKSPFQALTSGAGATMTGANEEEHKNTKDAQGYLHAAIEAKRANDDAGYKSNYVQYLLKHSQETAASKNAAGNKNDSPTQLYLSAVRAVEPEKRGLNSTLAEMMKNGDPPEAIAKARAEGEARIEAQLQGHFVNLGLHPQTAAEIAKQPGNSEANPIDAGKLGITKENAAQKLKPGQYYINPTDKKLYRYNGVTPAVGSEPSTPAPADPMNPARGTMPAVAPAAAVEAP
jgi:hypothetical protein